MSNNNTCPYCGAYLDPGEQCDCTESLRDRLMVTVMKLDEEGCKLLLQSWKIHERFPELTSEECVKKAALVLEHQNGTAWVESPNSVPIIHQ